ncbi:MAG: MptD family putative ECF transporter S component [Treponemataceae bacterium]|nr:MptD family putative ECF transporter S component [Treponemataceae bacterium]
METKRLTGKDLINVGIYTALNIVVQFLVGMLNAIPVMYPPILFLIPIVDGIPMMLYYSKIEKFGMLSITGIICAAFYYISGYTWVCVVFLAPAAIIADIILKLKGYKKFSSMLISYMVFSLGILGGPANLWLAGESYWAKIEESMGKQYVDQLAYYMPSWMLYVGIGLTLLGGLIGAFLGRKLLNKHFKKAGIV